MRDVCSKVKEASKAELFMAFKWHVLHTCELDSKPMVNPERLMDIAFLIGLGNGADFIAPAWLEDCPALPIKKGDRVKIKKDAFIKTTNQQPNYHCKRSFVVTVVDVSPGFSYDDSWVGSGKYWFFTDMANCEEAMA